MALRQLLEKQIVDDETQIRFASTVVCKRQALGQQVVMSQLRDRQLQGLGCIFFRQLFQNLFNELKQMQHLLQFAT